MRPESPGSPTDSASTTTREGAGPAFVTTHWSEVQRAGRNDTPGAHAALEQLCRSYWHPLYHYVRRRGYGPDDAGDLTQGFFARLLGSRTIEKADPARGRFRSFLLASLKHYLADEWDKSRALKRGGPELQMLPLEPADEETRLAREPSDSLTPEQAYERRWATALLEQVYRRLAEEFRRQGRGEQFRHLSVALAGERGAVPYADIARETQLTTGTVKVAVHRLRRRYRHLLREAIAETVTEPDEIEEELRHLQQVLSG